jgi:predicted GTPase
VNQQEAAEPSEGRPIQLIRILPSGKIEINEEALAIIASIDEPVGFVSLVGKTRTGKSCLLNKLLHIAGDGVIYG